MGQGRPSALGVTPEVILIALWVLGIAFLDGLVFRSLAPGVVALMNVLMAAGLGVLLFTASRSATALAEQNARLTEAERAAAALATELQTVLESLTTLLFVTDRDGRLIRANKAFTEQIGCAWFGRDVEAIRRPDESFPILHEDGAPYLTSDLPHQRALAGETVESETVGFRRRDGRTVLYLVSSSPIRDAGTQEVTGSVTLLRDVSSLAQLERLKDEFLFTASHELRTPLAVIRGYAELSLAAGRRTHASETDGDETTQLALRRILGEVDQMAGLLEEMLQIARIEAGRVSVNSHEVNLRDLTTAEISLLSIGPEYARVVMDVDAVAQPLVCRLDRVAYRQVLVNLVSNALKYSPEQSPVMVSVSESQGQAVLSVVDQGAGIPEDELPMIFEKFYRSQNAVNSGSAGLGLGLYITSRLVDLMAGHIQVESRPGHGTKFRVAFPLVAQKL